MAGGVLIVLGLNLEPGERHITNYIGTGMHGGTMYIRGRLDDYQIGKGVGQVALDEADHTLLRQVADQYSAYFGYNADAILSQPITKLQPLSLRPYGRYTLIELIYSIQCPGMYVTKGACGWISRPHTPFLPTTFALESNAD